MDDRRDNGVSCGLLRRPEKTAAIESDHNSDDERSDQHDDDGESS